MQKPGEHKTRWDLVPFSELDKVAQCFTKGAEKHDDEGWKTIPNAKEKYFAAAMRHIAAYRGGQVVDTETRQSHLTCAISNLMIVNYHTGGQ